MKVNKAEVRFPGIEGIVSAEYTLMHGIRPGVAVITITPQKALPTEEGTLEFRYPGFNQQFPECIPDQTTFEFNEAGELWRFQIKDRRWKWACEELHGRYNLRLPDELDLLEKTESLDFPTEKKPKELLEECLMAMNEAGWKINADLSAVQDMRPTVEWDFANPAEELARLCDLFGLRVVLGLNNKVSIENLGKGADLPSGYVTNDAGGLDTPETPSELKFICGPTRFQIDVLLEAIGEDTDGRLKPIDELSYKPSGGWTAANVPYFTGNLGDERTRELARKTIYRYYRIHDNPQGADGKPLKVIGDALLSDDKLQGGEGFEVKERWQLLPLGDAQTMIVEDRTSGLRHYMAAIVYGIYFPYGIKGTDNGNNFDPGPNQLIPPRRFSIVDPITSTTIARGGDTVVNSGFTIDRERGIVIFNLPIYKHNSSNRQEPARLILRTSCVVRDQKYRTPHRYTVRRRLPNRGDTGPYLVKDDDLFLIARPQVSKHSRGGTDQGDYELPTTAFEDNSDLVEEQASAALDTVEESFQSLKTRVVTYEGWQAVKPDGAIQQVSWSLTDKGAFTKASRNDEIAVPSVPYRERRFYEKIGSERAQRALDAAFKVVTGGSLPGPLRQALNGTRIT